MLELTEFNAAFQLALLGVVVCCVLMRQDHLLDKYDTLLHKLPNWLAYPLGHCVKCFTGQLALWYGVFCMELSYITHMIFISVAILFAMVISRLVDRWGL